MWNGKDAERPQIVTTQSVVTRENLNSWYIFNPHSLISRRFWIIAMNDNVQYPIRVRLKSGDIIDGLIAVYEQSPDDPLVTRVVMQYDGNQFVANTADGCFEALTRIRRELEPQGVSLICNGASLDVYPSRMSASMGIGTMAYRLTPGKQALQKDLVHIFECNADFIPSTVQQQEEYFDTWIDSL